VTGYLGASRNTIRKEYNGPEVPRKISILEKCKVELRIPPDWPAFLEDFHHHQLQGFRDGPQGLIGSDLYA
jgi:hypothetical protein